MDVTSPAPLALARLVVALDGPAGSGKSSVARGVASRLGLRYLDTGAMYRAITWWMLRQGVDVEDPAAVAALVDQPTLVCGTDPGKPTIAVDGLDVSESIRGHEVTSAVSAVSAVAQVRRRLVADQRTTVGDGGIVVEGRDIGTVVTPNAPVKVFLTACPTARAERRTAELVDAGETGEVAATVASTARDMARRDRFDSTRVTSPLVRADDAEELDTTSLTLDEVIERVLTLVWVAAPPALARPVPARPVTARPVPDQT